MNFQQEEIFLCPYCGQKNSLSIDLSAGGRQNFVVDCEVCCAPIAIDLQIRGGEILSLYARRENE